MARIVPGKFAANFPAVTFAFNILAVVIALSCIAPVSTLELESSEVPIQLGAKLSAVKVFAAT